MANSPIPGGAYLSADGKTWHDANGQIIQSPFGKQQDPEPVQPVVVDPSDDTKVYIGGNISNFGDANGDGIVIVESIATTRPEEEVHAKKSRKGK